MYAKIHPVLDILVGSIGYPVSNIFIPSPSDVFVRCYNPGKTFAICYLSILFTYPYLVSKDLNIVKLIKLEIKSLHGCDSPRSRTHESLEMNL